jgi:ssDNA-binding Zn-finger/Zn-ribbon topoisomerase 1
VLVGTTWHTVSGEEGEPESPAHKKMKVVESTRLEKLHESVCKKEDTKYHEGDECPKCHKGKLEYFDMKGEEYLACDNQECEFTYSEKIIKKEGESPVDTKTAMKIMDISGDILDKYNHNSGRDLLKHKDEFLAQIKGLKITQKDIDALENNNFHTDIEIIKAAGLVHQ